MTSRIGAFCATCVVLIIGVFCLTSADAGRSRRAPSLAEETVHGAGSKNVFGAPLKKCDRPAYMNSLPRSQRDTRWPTTGYIRNNECTATSMDAGSHYVCVDMPNATLPSGETYTTFWTETHQAQDGYDAARNFPKPGPWCICMWAFARMFIQHPEFDQMLDCEATNEWVIDEYDLADPVQRSALRAVCNKCDVASNAVSSDVRQKCAEASGPAATPVPKLVVEQA